MTFLEHIDLAEFTTFRLKAKARYFAELTLATEIAEAYVFAEKKKIPVIILGGGSNVLINDSHEHDALFLHVQIAGFEIIDQSETITYIKIAAGEVWDSVVGRSVELGLSGIEAMSLIPGSAGATVIQNVGAYGTEIKDTLVSLEAYDLEQGSIRTFTNSECEFAYRDSIFKHRAKGKYLILSITLVLSKNIPTMPNYPGVKKYFEMQGVTTPTLAQIREAIIAIRTIKLPDPKDIASVGSFFKNPIIPASLLRTIQERYPEVQFFEMGGKMYKVPAGWLIDTLGWKGKDFGRLAIYPHNALVLINKGGATFAELEDVVAQIKKAVFGMFGITLEEEPIIIK